MKCKISAHFIAHEAQTLGCFKMIATLIETFIITRYYLYFYIKERCWLWGYANGNRLFYCIVSLKSLASRRRPSAKRLSSIAGIDCYQRWRFSFTICLIKQAVSVFDKLSHATLYYCIIPNLFIIHLTNLCFNTPTASYKTNVISKNYAWFESIKSFCHP